jgi:hypothetical protein
MVEKYPKNSRKIVGGQVERLTGECIERILEGDVDVVVFANALVVDGPRKHRSGSRIYGSSDSILGNSGRLGVRIGVDRRRLWCRRDDEIDKLHVAFVAATRRSSEQSCSSWSSVTFPSVGEEGELGRLWV